MTKDSKETSSSAANETAGDNTPPEDYEVPSKEEAQGIVEKGAKKITEKDIENVLNKSKQLEEMFTKGPLREFIDNAKLLLDVVSDYWTGKYREIPYFSIAAIVFTLLYVLSPIDAIPDWIPGIGLLDDAAMVSVCMFLVLQDLRDYETWKINQAKEEKEEGNDDNPEGA